KIWLGTGDLGVELRLGRRIMSLDLDGRRAIDDDGEEYGYEKLLLAIGGSPRELGSSDGGVVYYRTLDDYRKVRELPDGAASFVVIGGGFIGSELAASLISNGAKMTMV